MTKDEIRAVFLAHGFTIKDGETDLKPYVFNAATELLRVAYQLDRKHEAELKESKKPVWDAIDFSACLGVETTEWFLAFMKPVHPGYYKVWSRPHIAAIFQLRGRPYRYWDGTQWLQLRNGNKSIFGSHESHMWCGLVRPATR